MATLTFNSRSARKLFLVIGSLFLLYWLSDFVIMLFVSYILMASIMPLVKRFEAFGLPRWSATLSVYLLTLLMVGLFLSLTFGPLIHETQTFFSEVPVFVQESIASLNIEGSPFQPYVYDAITTIAQQLSSVPLDIVRFGTNIFGGVLNVILMLILTFYLVLEHEKLHKFMAKFLPVEETKDVEHLFANVDNRLGAWFRGQLLLMVIIGVVTYVALMLLGLPYALPLAIIAGLLEIVPIIGPIISSIPALLVAISISPLMAIVVAVLFLLIQQLEGTIIVPRVMKSAVGLDPLVVIIALTVGGRVGGPVGALLSIPALVVGMIIYHAWSTKNPE